MKKPIENSYTPRIKKFACVMSTVFPDSYEVPKITAHNDIERSKKFTNFNFELLRQFRLYKLNEI